MKKYKNKSLGDTISTIGSMLLFLLFTGCLLMIIMVAAGTYSRISNNFDKTFGISASLRYMSNKVKSADDTQIAANGKALCMKNGDALDIIYYENGALYEKTTPIDSEPEMSGGSKIFNISNLDVSEHGNLIKITVTFDNKDNSTYARRG